MPNLYIERLPINMLARQEPALLPEKATTHAANYDVRAYITAREVVCFNCLNFKFTYLNKENPVVLNAGDRAIIPTGFKMCTDVGWKVELYPRSGNSIKLGVTLCNAVGQIDSDYRDEVMVLVSNNSDSPVTINHNDRIAQLAIEQVHNIHMIEGTLPTTESNRDGGMGHTGSE